MAVADVVRIDGARWMTDCPSVRGRTLKQIVMPGSHDAGMYCANHCTTGAGASNTQTQTRTIAEQLDIGVRQFDLRPVLTSGELLCGHFSKVPVLGWTGCYGAVVRQVLEEVKAFVAVRGRRELVLLNFSHTANADADFRGFNADEWKVLFELVADVLDGCLHAEPKGTRLIHPIDRYVQNGSRVLACFEGAPINTHWAGKGMHGYTTVENGWKRLPAADLVMFDHYSHSPNPQTVVRDQLEKLANSRNHEVDQYLLAWTRTHDNQLSVGTGIGEAVRGVPWLGPYVTGQTDQVSILTLARNMNKELRGALAGAGLTRATMPNVISVDDVQPEVLNICIWLMETLAES